jgi:mono/diheme cytochrome c family protein
MLRTVTGTQCRRSVAARRAVVAMAVVMLAGCDRLGGRPPGLLRADDPQVLALGKAVYAAHCAACHGDHLQGQPNWRLRDASGRLPAPPHDASGHTWHHPDKVLFTIVKYGVAKAAHLDHYDSAMPAFDGVLTDAEIVAVLSWIKAQWPPRIRKLQEEVNAAAEHNEADSQ